MNAEESESIFQDYLRSCRIPFEENYKVKRGDIDFCICAEGQKVLCDVKEVRDSAVESIEGIDAQRHIRSDIRKLREKFGDTRPNYPVLLVTINFSKNFFTGLTVARALLGEVGIEFDRNTKAITRPLHHQSRGNAVLTQGQNRSISGVFVFDRAQSRHCLFLSPFADNLPSLDLFPGVRIVKLDRASTETELIELGNIMFFNIEFG